MAPQPRPAGGRLARRLFLLFVAAALLPLLLSDWLALSAVHRIADDLQQQAHVARTRELSRQVLDRLLAARELLAALPPADGAAAPGDRLPGLGTHFLALQRQPGAATPAATPGTQPAVTLALEPTASGPPRVALQRQADGAMAWHARLDPASLWRPLSEGAADTRWRVTDSAGQLLWSQEPEADIAPEAADSRESRPWRSAQVLLPLDGVLGSDGWVFEHEAPRDGVRFMGAPLSRWLGLLGAGTVLAVALLALGRIRRIFRPLEALAAATRRLAAGDTQVRVAPRQGRRPADEVDELTAGFNHMADRIDHQLQALRELAAIDHDILRGAPMQALAERLLQQLRLAAPGCEAVLAWCEAPPASSEGPPPRPQAVRTPGCAHGAAADTAPLPLQRPDEAAQDREPSPWWPPRPAGWRRHLRSVERDGRIRGLLAVVTPPGGRNGLGADEGRQGLEEQLDALRDRLAVALAARQRDGELAWRATHDSLTGLLNRSGLHEQLDAALAALAPAPVAPGLALLLIDLDHFKDLNDTRGHDAGDALLCAVAARLRAEAPPGATVARLGGDEFVLLLPQAGAEAALQQARRLTQRLREPFEVQGLSALVGASAGIALAPAHATTRQELARRADIALYTAKAQRGSVCLFDAAQDAEASERATRAAELRHAIARGELRLHYQPRVAAPDGALVSVEALVRWQHPRLGLLQPGHFIDVAERTGLIEELGQAVLEQACRQMAAWRHQGLEVPRVSVNVSMQQLRSGRLPGCVRQALQRHGLPATALELEVTESLLADDAQGAAAQLRELHELGVAIALDDFGTGYSSLAQLRRLPLDVMKIDRSFVADLDHDGSALAIARTIVALAGALGLRVVAEGVETEAQARRLRELGCHELQGYLFARPLPGPELEAFVQARPRSGHGAEARRA
jgi:diguanylate cyclase (GGDEF)-like protein